MMKLILNIIESLIQSLKFNRIKKSLRKERNNTRIIKKSSEEAEIDFYNDELEEKKYFKTVISKGVLEEKDDKKTSKVKKNTNSDKSNRNNKKIEEKKIEDIESFDIREEPDSKSKKIGTIKKDAKYKKLKSVPHWIKISYADKEGYLSKISANKMDF